MKIVLLRAGTEVGTIAASISVGTWRTRFLHMADIHGRNPGSDYKVSVQSISQPTIKDVSNNYFTITHDRDTSILHHAHVPQWWGEWQRYTSHAVTWDYTGNPGSAVKIMLLKGQYRSWHNQPPALRSARGGQGSYTWQIYYGRKSRQ